MKRVVGAVVIVCVAQVAAAAPTCPKDQPVERPWVTAAALGPGFGFFYSTHGRLGLQAGRRLWRRLELDVEVRLGFAAELFGVEPAVRVGVLFPLSRQALVALVVRGGYASYRLVEPARTRWVGTPLLGVATEVRLPLKGAWVLRVIPAACTAYLVSPLWGLALEPSVGLARRF